MDQVTQQNAALVEEAAAAAESMQDQAARLAQVAAGFQLEHLTTAAPVRAARPAKAAIATTQKLAPRPPQAAAGKATAGKPAMAKAAGAAAHKTPSHIAGDQDWEEF
jgi:methyl-accepting chemotaxis protein